MKQSPPPENPLLSLLINILLPVIVLNKGAHYLSPKYTLAIAVCFPLIYGAQDYIRRRHKNYVSLMGLFNILLTASFAVFNLTGIWFAFKDASLPGLLGVLVFGSAFTKNPAARMMFCNPHILKMDLIDQELMKHGKQIEFDALLRRTTIWLSGSFFVSAVANFFLARHIFENIDPTLEQDAQLKILNEQLAHMTWMGYVVIALPLMVFSGILIYNFLRKLAKMTEMSIDSMMNS
jgi:hypothetical protein